LTGKPDDEAEAPHVVVKHEAFGQRTRFDWFFVMLAVGGTWTAALIFAGLRSDMRDLRRDKVSHDNLLDWSEQLNTLNRGDLRVPVYKRPREDIGENR